MKECKHEWMWYISCCWTAMIIQWTFTISQRKIKTINWTQNFRIIQCSVFQGKTSFQIRMMRGLIIPLLLLSHNSHTKCRSRWELFVPTAHSLNSRCTFLCSVYNADCKKTPDCFFPFKFSLFCIVRIKLTLHSVYQEGQPYGSPGRLFIFNEWVALVCLE